MKRQADLYAHFSTALGAGVDNAAVTWGRKRAAWNIWLSSTASRQAQLEVRGQHAVEEIHIKTVHYVLVLGEPLNDSLGSDLKKTTANRYYVDSL